MSRRVRVRPAGCARRWWRTSRWSLGRRRRARRAWCCRRRARRSPTHKQQQQEQMLRQAHEDKVALADPPRAPVAWPSAVFSTASRTQPRYPAGLGTTILDIPSGDDWRVPALLFPFIAWNRSIALASCATRRVLIVCGVELPQAVGVCSAMRVRRCECKDRGLDERMGGR